ncbi:MAG: indolepyruvate oxidoreductase subunit beta family protein [Sphingobium sp.]
MMRDDSLRLPLAPVGDPTERPISIAIVAMGGQGGGVLTGWIVKLAEDAGWVAQSTSVPGVAQRTGATIYYVEMMRPSGNLKPVLAQMPTPGDVDIVLASEFMEAGRSVLRGIVTPGRTTLIASDHRSLTISEKSAPGLGIADSAAVTDAIGVTARQTIVFDMNALAVANGSVISAALFGSLAASGALPFTRTDYHAVIKADGKGVEASVRTFDAAFDQVTAPQHIAFADTASTLETAETRVAPLPPRPTDQRLGERVERIRRNLPQQAQDMAVAGLVKVVDFQDLAYGDQYIALLEGLLVRDKALGGETQDYAFTLQAAKYLANAMAYDDVVRVADLKTRRARYGRIAKEVGAGPQHILHTTEYMHPRLEEIAGILPAGFATWLQSRAGLYRWLDRKVSKGRRVRTYSAGWFIMLYVVAGLRWMRRSSLRHSIEVASRDRWLEDALGMAQTNYALGVEVLKCRRLIKGYSDTHARGQSKFAKVIAEIRSLSLRDDAAEWARRLREAAIRDSEGGDLEGLIKTIRSFT